MNNKFSLRHLILYVSILIILVSFGYYTSYAFFSAVVEGNESATNTDVTLANIETTFTTTSYINNERLIPLLPAEVDEQAKKVEFTVTNTENSTIGIEYNIYLEEFLISDNFKASEDLRYKLTKVVEGTEVLVAEGNFIGSTSGEKFELTRRETLNTNTSRDYILRIWIHDTEEEQPDLLEGTISGKVSVIGKIANYKCKRATTLHTTTCKNNAAGCKNTVGYDNEITYGNLGIEGTLTSGDAFDCDVNGDGDFSEETERFYYVSDVYTGGTSYNSNYAALIYYSNVKIEDDTVIPDNMVGIAYHKDNYNYQGPVTAQAYLPETSEKQWKNVSLSSQTRQIYNSDGGNATGGGTLPSYNYENKAARLIHAKEINVACNMTVGSRKDGELDTCSYLLENVNYDNSSNKSGYWLESPFSGNGLSVYSVVSNSRSILNNSAYYPGSCGVRPVIEVLKSDILY